MNPSAICQNCRYKQMNGHDGCYMAYKWMCPDWLASGARIALSSKDSALQVPVESLLEALRYHGYTGQLRKSGTVVI